MKNTLRLCVKSMPLLLMMIGLGFRCASQTDDAKFVITADQLKQIRIMEAEHGQCMENLTLTEALADSLKKEVGELKGINLQLQKENELNRGIISERIALYNSCKAQNEHYLEETIRLQRRDTFKKIMLSVSASANLVFLIFYLK